MTRISIELSGGLELLFGNQKTFPKIDVPCDDNKRLRLRELLAFIKLNLLQERPELFLAGDSVRPGILVLINDCDWELEGKGDYEVQDGDVISFISTLHGG